MTGFKQRNGAARLGMPLLQVEGNDVGRDYLYARGWKDRTIKKVKFRWFDAATVERLWPGSMKLTVKGEEIKITPVGAVVLPFPNDPIYYVARIFYIDGTHADAPRFLTPGGRECIAYIPATVKRKSAFLLLVESPFKAALACSKGLPCIGVNGCHGCHSEGARLPDLPDRTITSEAARQWFRPELLPYLGRKQKLGFITDADDRTNLQVLKSQLDLLDAADALGCIPIYRPLPAGGLDDYLVNHSLDEFWALPVHQRKSRYVQVMRNPFRDRTEFGVSDRFVVIHGRDIRFDPKVKQWFVWSDGYWQPSETPAFERMRKTIATLKDEAKAEHDATGRKLRDRAAIEFQKDNRCNACLAVASNDPRIHIDAAKFDVDCDLIGVQNGNLNLKAGELLQPKREHMITARAATTFDPQATAPLFEAFINRACGDDAEKIELCQEVCGAALLGRPIRMEVIFAQGPAFSGKSVFIEVLNDMLGDYATATKSEILLRHNSGDGERPSPFLVSLRGKRLVTCSELPENTPLDDALIKDLTGGDMITARALLKAPVTFRNTARIIIRCNHLPVVTGSDDSIWHRLLIIPFSVVIPPEERDVDLRSKIAGTELPGVLNWALEGLQRYVARGCKFSVPRSVQAIIDKHRMESDILGLWIDDHWKIDKTKTKPPYRALQSIISTDYRNWCQENGHHPVSTKNLWAKLRERCGYDAVKRLEGGHKWALGWKRKTHASSSGSETLATSADDKTFREVAEEERREKKVVSIDAAKRRKGQQ